ncbi:MAG: hypothetical protein ACI4V7_01745 [Succinivibrionaceae bacterium]
MSIKKFLKSLGLIITVLSIGNNVVAEEQFYNEDDHVIENFKLTNEITDSYIAKLNKDVFVISSSENDGVNIAFVQPKDPTKKRYIIRNVISYVCKERPNICLMNEISNAKRVGKTTVFKVTVSNYDEWKDVISILKNNSKIKSITPSFYYGDDVSTY